MADMIFKGCENYQALSEYACHCLIDIIRKKPCATICLATGGTPELTYALFAEEVHRQKLDVSQVTFVKLDEWLGVPLATKGTCETFLRERVLKPLDIHDNQFISFDSERDIALASERINMQITQRGGLDLCILGLGKNGHLGLNEPAEELEPSMHIAQLDERTRSHEMLKEASYPVKEGITLGLKEILSAREILFLVAGSGKQEAFTKLMTRKITTQLPASFLWLHQHVTCVYDSEEY
jgi:galactosamine-6-phosphate isomerase